MLKQHVKIDVFLYWQLWIVALCLTQTMAKLVTMLEQHSVRGLPTVVIQATGWWEAALALVKLQEDGLGKNQNVQVCCYYILLSEHHICVQNTGTLFTGSDV